VPGSNRIRGALLSCSASLGVDISGSGSILIRATNEDGVLSAVQILLHVVGVGVVVVGVGVVVVGVVVVGVVVVGVVVVGVVVVGVGVVVVGVVVVGVGVGVTVVVECLFLPAALTFLAAQKSEGTQNDWSSLKQKS
jgi:hypothetical protein